MEVMNTDFAIRFGIGDSEISESVVLGLDKITVIGLTIDFLVKTKIYQPFDFSIRAVDIIAVGFNVTIKCITMNMA